MANIQAPVDILLHAFPGIPRQEAEELIAKGEVRSYPSNTILCYENALASTFYIILKGKVKVTKVIDQDEVRLLKILEAGDFFGEMALIHDAPRAASVTTTAPTTVLEIRKDAFDVLMQRSATLSLAMVQEVSRRLRENDAMAIEDLRVKAGELALAYERLAEQDLARGEFLSTVAHELRTPLTAANGFLDLIRKNNLKGQELDSALDNVQRNIQQIISLVNNILFLQEMDMILLDFQDVDISAVVENVVEAFRDQTTQNSIHIKVNVEPNLPLIPADTQSLERAFSAILENAIKFSPNGGDIAINMSSVDNLVHIEFQDQGIGIDPESLPRVFDRFYHQDQDEDQVYSGIGLGLSIAREVINQHGGHIDIRSEIGKGSSVTVRLKTDR